MLCRVEDPNPGVDNLYGPTWWVLDRYTSNISPIVNRSDPPIASEIGRVPDVDRHIVNATPSDRLSTLTLNFSHEVSGRDVHTPGHQAYPAMKANQTNSFYLVPNTSFLPVG